MSLIYREINEIIKKKKIPNHIQHTDKIYLFARDQYEAKN